jgi:hypothetical protein
MLILLQYCIYGSVYVLFLTNMCADPKRGLAEIRKSVLCVYRPVNADLDMCRPVNADLLICTLCRPVNVQTCER